MTEKIVVKTAKVNPKVYAVVVSSKRGVILHLGTYYSLDDAYNAAKEELYHFSPHKDNDSVEIDFWSTMDPTSVLKSFIDTKARPEEPTVEAPKVIEKTVREQIRDVKKQKNTIMQNIINKNDRSLLVEAKTLFSKAELKFMQDKLTINQ